MGADSAYLKNSPIEITQAEVPIQIVRYGLMPDSGGPGRWRGGLATSLDFKVFAPNSRITARNRDRSKFRPWGTLGGKAAAPSNFVLNPNTPRERILGNTDFVIAEPGDVVHIHSPGGGGRGDPLAREPWRVLEDVERGYVSVAAAVRDYGVVIDDNGPDEAATTARRREMAATRNDRFFDFGPEREEFEKKWSPEAYDELTRILADLPIHWRFFVKGKIFELISGFDGPSGAGRVRSAFAAARTRFPAIPEQAPG